MAIIYSLPKRLSMELPVDFTHPAWLAGFGTVIGYGLIIAVLTVMVFLIPYAFFAFL